MSRAEQNRKIARLLKQHKANIQSHVNEQRYGGILLENVEMEIIEQEMEAQYRDVLRDPNNQKISGEYDLGNWQQ